MNVRAIANLLGARGIVSDPLLFRLLCRLRGSDESLQAGEYRLAPLMTPQQVLSKLTSGEVIVHQVTFPEGSTLSDVADILADARLGDRQALLHQMRDPDFARSLGLTAPTLEGYLFPSTYRFVRSQDGTAVLREMVRQFRHQVDPLWAQRPPASPLATLHEAVILASLVEKEAATDPERPIIASVFRNRLERGMKLQSDPTSVYDLVDFKGPVTAAHLKRESPFNTYLHAGLPPGPICNPGLPSLAAAIGTADVPYLYFVSNHDGTHTFSITLAEHQQAVREYRRKREQESNHDRNE